MKRCIWLHTDTGTSDRGNPKEQYMCLGSQTPVQNGWVGHVNGVDNGANCSIGWTKTSRYSLSLSLAGDLHIPTTTPLQIEFSTASVGNLGMWVALVWIHGCLGVLFLDFWGHSEAD
ncbi:hypothetical protein LOK49_LG06G03514 [Camellia lanceoleosa]|uniref:Uncharacterized protein n=1 Tax=Camellia lanceoleosa TaxID=1840588 RepID=A0ACC0HDF0_9ERIC|nr:hypothetical protein LOK49_LG06G03514 [Camellia lanceoleosa]